MEYAIFLRTLFDAITVKKAVYAPDGTLTMVAFVWKEESECVFDEAYAVEEKGGEVEVGQPTDPRRSDDSAPTSTTANDGSAAVNKPTAGRATSDEAIASQPASSACGDASSSSRCDEAMRNEPGRIKRDGKSARQASAPASGKEKDYRSVAKSSVKKKGETASTANKAATKLQSRVQGVKARAARKEREAAVAIIQKHARGRATRVKRATGRVAAARTRPQQPAFASERRRRDESGLSQTATAGQRGRLQYWALRTGLPQRLVDAIDGLSEEDQDIVANLADEAKRIKFLERTSRSKLAAPRTVLRDGTVIPLSRGMLQRSLRWAQVDREMLEPDDIWQPLVERQGGKEDARMKKPIMRDNRHQDLRIEMHQEPVAFAPLQSGAESLAAHSPAPADSGLPMDQTVEAGASPADGLLASTVTPCAPDASTAGTVPFLRPGIDGVLLQHLFAPKVQRAANVEDSAAPANALKQQTLGPPNPCGGRGRTLLDHLDTRWSTALHAHEEVKESVRTTPMRSVSARPGTAFLTARSVTPKLAGSMLAKPRPVSARNGADNRPCAPTWPYSPYSSPRAGRHVRVTQYGAVVVDMR